MDRRLERLSDEIIELGYEAGIDLIVEEADFDEEPEKQGKVVFIMNNQVKLVVWVLMLMIIQIKIYVALY